MMKTRLYAATDYALMAEWWAARGMPPIPEVMLPALGIIAEDDEGEPASAAWVYLDNSTGVAWMAWVTTRPDLTPLRAERMLQLIVGAVEEAAKAQGRGLLFTMTKRFGLGRWLERDGWTANDRHSTQFFKPLSFNGR